MKWYFQEILYFCCPPKLPQPTWLARWMKTNSQTRRHSEKPYDGGHKVIYGPTVNLKTIVFNLERSEKSSNLVMKIKIKLLSHILILAWTLKHTRNLAIKFKSFGFRVWLSGPGFFFAIILLCRLPFDSFT